MQFKISEDFNDIVIDKDIDYYQNMTEVPDYILKFIEEKCQNIVFYNIREQKYYDAEGFHLLDENFTCERCHKTYNKEKFQIVIDYKEFTSFVCFFVFEVKDGIPFLYIFKRKFQNKDDIYLKSTGISDLFQVTKKGLYQIFTKEYLSYESYNNYMNADSEEFDFEKWEAFDYFSSDYNFLDTESLEELKKTSVYQYTYIWKLKDYLKNKSISTSMITHLPLYYKEFEYLIKLGLYTLAIDYSFFITYKNNFKDTFGVEKKYYPLMKEMDISMDELELLRLYPTMDKEIIKMFSYHLRYTKEVLKYTSLDSLKDYFKKQNLESHNISEYIDYLKASEKLKLDLKDKKILFPDNFMEMHDKLLLEIELSTSPEKDEKIQTLAKLLRVNNYEDEKYVIFPASDIKSLLEESRQMSNCVRTYIDKIVNQNCQIYFMRKKEEQEKSFVTIEVVNGKVVQARTRFNGIPDYEVKQVLKYWEQNLVVI